ncbi:MAG: sporulation protein [Oscillospiraceae bacterium]|nr:sporulation protein [Oscillospiraceae bacterium]
MKRKFAGHFGIIVTLLCLFTLICGTDGAASAVKSALDICGGVILPSLLPFFFLSGILSALGFPQLLARRAAGITEKLFHASGCAAAPLFIGLLGGYPVGAACIAELTEKSVIKKEEAERLLPFCNNTGPAFIVGAVGGIFGSVKLGLLLYGVHILAALCVGLLFAGKAEISTRISSFTLPEVGITAVLPAAVKSSVDKCLNICGFVIFFSVLSSLLETAGVLTEAALIINKFFKSDIGFCRCMLGGIMELGSGIAGLAALPPAPESYALASFILGFGSLSVHCQTLAVVNSAKIKCARHFAGRIIHGLLSALFTYWLSSLLRI